MTGENDMTHILIVDDSSFMRKSLNQLLTKHGFVVTEAGNGFEAILHYRKHSPDLVLLDIHMPEITGVEVLKRLMVINPDAKVIMCSALATQFLIDECLQIGAKDYVMKPNFNDLLGKVKQLAN